MIFKRFNDFSAMLAFVRNVTNDGREWEIESHIYTDDEIWFRPGITLFPKDNFDAGFKLRWNAYCDEQGIDFIGKGSRVAANDKGGDYVNKMIEVLTMND